MSKKKEELQELVVKDDVVEVEKVEKTPKDKKPTLAGVVQKEEKIIKDAAEPEKIIFEADKLDLVVGNVLTSVDIKSDRIILNFGSLKQVVCTPKGVKTKIK